MKCDGNHGSAMGFGGVVGLVIMWKDSWDLHC